VKNISFFRRKTILKREEGMHFFFRRKTILKREEGMHFLFQSVKIGGRRIKKHVRDSVLQYLKCVLITKGRKNCVSMAKEMQISHDSLYKFFSFSTTCQVLARKSVLFLAKSLSKRSKKSYLIIDDTNIPKIFARVIKMISIAYNSTIKRPVKSLNIVVLAWSNGIITIPIGFEWWHSKTVNEETYVKKSSLAKKLITEVRGKIEPDYILLDGFYASAHMMDFLEKNSIHYEMRIARNRKVKTSCGACDQLQNHKALKLKRNQKHKTVYAYYKGKSRYFSAHKRKKLDGTYKTVYTVSNLELSPRQHCKVYEGRWEIEKMFRTLKQSLGLGDCQARTTQKQGAHFWIAFLAYAFLEVIKFEENFQSPETVCGLIRDSKNVPLEPLFHRFQLHFSGFA
jgi:hypothetical protein